MPEAIDFKLTRRSTVTMQVHADLRLRIISGELRPKASISENEIAERYGVSRTPAREVLGRLEEEGLVEIYPQYGSFIAPIRIDDVHDSQFVRECLECAALAKALPALTAEDCEKLKANIALQAALVQGPEAQFVAADEEMHQMFFNVAGHARAWSVVAAAKIPLDRIRFLSARRVDKRQSVVAEHQAIVDGCLAGDSKAALAALRLHLRGAFASIVTAMKDHPDFFGSDLEEARPAGGSSSRERKRPEPATKVGAGQVRKIR